MRQPKQAKKRSPKPANKQDERSRRTVDGLVAAARDLFARHGFAGASAEETVVAANVTRGAHYHHSDGKKGLFRALVEQVQSEIKQRVRDAVEGADDPWKCLLRKH